MTCTDILEELRTVYLQRVTRKVRPRLPRDCRRLAYIPNVVTCVLQLIDLHNQHSSGVNMTSQVVNLQVTASIPIDCDFWAEDDGWKGLCKSLSITVQGSSFEDAKKNMATELQAQIEKLLREHPKKSARRVA
jgi:hypothetical protein